MSINTPPVATPLGDFASGERTEAPTPEEVLEQGLHGDFSAGERTQPLTSAEETPGSFGGTDA